MPTDERASGFYPLYQPMRGGRAPGWRKENREERHRRAPLNHTTPFLHGLRAAVLHADVGTIRGLSCMVYELARTVPARRPIRNRNHDRNRNRNRNQTYGTAALLVLPAALPSIDVVPSAQMWPHLPDDPPIDRALPSQQPLYPMIS